MRNVWCGHGPTRAQYYSPFSSRQSKGRNLPEFGGFLVGLLALPGNFPKIPELQFFRIPLRENCLGCSSSPIVEFFEVFGNGSEINFCGPIVKKTPPIPALAFTLNPTEKPQIKKTVNKAVFCFDFVDLFAEELAIFLFILDCSRWLRCPLDVLASCGFRQEFITVATPTLPFYLKKKNKNKQNFILPFF